MTFLIGKRAAEPPRRSASYIGIDRRRPSQGAGSDPLDRLPTFRRPHAGRVPARGVSHRWCRTRYLSTRHVHISSCQDLVLAPTSLLEPVGTSTALLVPDDADPPHF